MSRKKKHRPGVRDKPQQRSAAQTTAWLCAPDAYDTLVCQGYTSLSQNPEICAAVDTIARLIGSMTIHLMENTDKGDVRIRDELARKVDIHPNSTMGRSNFIHWIVKTMLLSGDGNAVVWPRTKNGLLQELLPVPAPRVAFQPDGWGYRVFIDGQPYQPDELMHFAINPDENEPWRGTGYRVALHDVVHNLKQAAETEKGFMESKWKPSLIVKVDSFTQEFASQSGRKRLLNEYISTDTAGEPWIVPAQAVDVKEVRPLSLKDLAIDSMVQLDKRTVAAILGIPAFVLGVGNFNREEWNNFISARIKPVAQIIEQELTRKLLLSPSRYFKFNQRSLYSYDLRDLAAIADDQYVRGIMSGNEVRDWLSMPPADGLDEMIILENYIPRGMIGNQKKLNGGE